MFYFSFNNIKVIKDIVNRLGNKKFKLDYREDLVFQFQKIIEPLLISCLGDRINEMCFCVSQESISIGKSQEPCNTFLIGLKLNSQKANIVVERGPTANLPEVILCCIIFINNSYLKIVIVINLHNFKTNIQAKEFRAFWGEKSQLRRFKDGEVCEAVVWALNNVAVNKKRCIIRDIVRYVFSQKLLISKEKFIYVADQAEAVLQNPFVSYKNFCNILC